MALSQNGFTFGGSSKLIDGALQSQAPTVGVQVQRVAGLNGESHLVDKPKGRVFTCNAILRGYSSAALLASALDSIDGNKGQLSGTLTVTGNAATTVPRATFIDCVRRSAPQKDANSGNWFQRIQLVWVQRRI